MQLSKENQKAFLISAHQSIESQSVDYAKDLLEGRYGQPDYPPNSGFTIQETDALKLLQGNKELHSAIRKVLASCAAGVVFDLLSLVDGITDPTQGEWSGVILADKLAGDQNSPSFLHDEFYDTYWNWRGMRPDKTWTLDLLPE